MKKRRFYYDNVRCRKNGRDGADRDSHHFGDCFDRAVSVREEARSAAGTAAADHCVSVLIVDKKMMKIKDAVAAGLPEEVSAQTPVFMKLAKLPVVKAKVGPRVMTLMADPTVFQQLPVKKECKVAISGLYIRELKSVRGGSVPEAPKKKGFFAGLRDRFTKK